MWWTNYGSSTGKSNSSDRPAGLPQCVPNHVETEGRPAGEIN